MKNKRWIAVLCASMLLCGMTVSAAPFDAAYYARQNPDVAAAVGNDAAALEAHYNVFGMAEGRAANPQDAADGASVEASGLSAVFDAAYYAQQNPDVVAVFGTEPLSLYTHFITIGVREGRSGCAGFNAAAYKAANPDLAAALGDDLAAYVEHYMTTGQTERRSTGPSGTRPVSGGKASDSDPYARFASSGGGSHHSKSHGGSGPKEDGICKHNWIVLQTTLENCRREEHLKCSKCGHSVWHGGTEHTPGEWTVVSSASCISEGTEEQRCKICGERLDSRSIPMLEHDYVYSIGDHGIGQHDVTCKNCAYQVVEDCDIFYVDFGDAHKKRCKLCGHSVSYSHKWDASSGTCTECGAECSHEGCAAGETCSVCGMTLPKDGETSEDTQEGYSEAETSETTMTEMSETTEAERTELEMPETTEAERTELETSEATGEEDAELETSEATETEGTGEEASETTEIENKD